MYRTKIKGKKWWWPLFVNFFEVAKVNAWKLYQKTNHMDMSLLEFQRILATSLLKTPIYDTTEQDSEPSTSHTGRPSAFQEQILKSVTKDKIAHIIVRNPSDSRRRCRLCHSHTVTICKKCNVPVHAKCFETFHK